MPIYGRGLYYGSPTGTSKDAYVVPDDMKWRTFSGFGTDPTSAWNTGKIVAVASLLLSVGLFVGTLMLGKKEG